MSHRTGSPEQEAALRCLTCPHLKSGAGVFQCLRRRCRYKSQLRRFATMDQPPSQHHDNG